MGQNRTSEKRFSDFQEIWLVGLLETGQDRRHTILERLLIKVGESFTLYRSLKFFFFNLVNYGLLPSQISMKLRAEENLFLCQYWITESFILLRRNNFQERDEIYTPAEKYQHAFPLSHEQCFNPCLLEVSQSMRLVQ